MTPKRSLVLPMNKIEAISRLLPGLLAAAVFFGPPAETQSAGVADGIVPHRAVYELDLASPRGEGGVVEIGGQVEFTWNDVCDGWTVTQKSQFVVGRADGYDVVFGSTVSSWESKDGLRYRFFIKRNQNGEETESIRGVASLESPGGPGTARYTEPEEKTTELPKGTTFPSAHSIEILEQAIAGQGLSHWTTQFDGTGEDDGLAGVSAALVAALPPEEAGIIESPLLEGQPSWRIAMAYFGMGQGEAEPNQEQHLRIYKNGVVDFFSIDYGTFAFDAELIELEEYPKPDC